MAPSKSKNWTRERPRSHRVANELQQNQQRQKHKGRSSRCKDAEEGPTVAHQSDEVEPEEDGEGIEEGSADMGRNGEAEGQHAGQIEGCQREHQNGKDRYVTLLRQGGVGGKKGLRSVHRQLSNSRTPGAYGEGHSRQRQAEDGDQPQRFAEARKTEHAGERVPHTGSRCSRVVRGVGCSQ
jgi:hypothetical protein